MPIREKIDFSKLRIYTNRLLIGNYNFKEYASFMQLVTITTIGCLLRNQSCVQYKSTYLIFLSGYYQYIVYYKTEGRKTKFTF